MSKNPNQKLKLLYLYQILLQRTDENHKLTTDELRAALERCGITAERKSIYSDIEALQNFGLDVICQRGTGGGYYVASREFELPELKLLVDAIQCSRFITEKKSNELIGKIEHLTSDHEAHTLQRQVYVSERVKTLNEQIYYNIDKSLPATLDSNVSNEKLKEDFDMSTVHMILLKTVFYSIHHSINKGIYRLRLPS